MLIYLYLNLHRGHVDISILEHYTEDMLIYLYLKVTQRTC